MKIVIDQMKTDLSQTKDDSYKELQILKLDIAEKNS
jgi:hypothetical protein